MTVRVLEEGWMNHSPLAPFLLLFIFFFSSGGQLVHASSALQAKLQRVKNGIESRVRRHLTQLRFFFIVSNTTLLHRYTQRECH